MSKRRKTGPLIPELPDHAAFVGIMSKLHRNQVEHFFFRVVRDRTTAIILRELAYWFDQSGKNPGYPRAKVFRDGFYWVARTKHELLDAHGIERKDVERAYQQTKTFVETKNMRFGFTRTTHWRFNLPRLLALFGADRIIKKHLDADSADETDASTASPLSPPARALPAECSATSLDSNIPECHAPASEPGIAECAAGTGKASHPYIQPSPQPQQAAATTGFAGPADAGTGGTSPSAPSGATAPEPPPERVESLQNKDGLIPARIHAVLESVRGLEFKEKWEKVQTTNRRTRKALGYLLIWQALFESERRHRRCPFGDQDVHRAWALAEEGVSVKRFREVLIEAQDVEGPDKGHNEVFMCQTQSRRFGQFCKHFTQIEGELLAVGNIGPE